MSINPPTAADSPGLLRIRARFVNRHRLRDYRLSAHHLMRLVRSCTADRAAIARIRSRFLPDGAYWIQWPGSSFDHMECLGRDRMPLVFVSHPYHVSDEGRADLELFRQAGLVVVEGGDDASWYGYGTTQILVAHPAFSGEVARPATRPIAPPVESAYTARLHRAAPALLALAREHAEQLAASIAMIPCTGPGGVTPCLSCELRVDYDRINALIDEVEGP